MATAIDPMVAKYEALKQLYDTTQEDVDALTKRLDVVRAHVAKTRAENEYLITQLCEYAPSDFESDQSEIEDDLLDKKLPLPRLDKPPTAAAKSAARRRAEKSAAAAAARKRRLEASRKAKSS